MNITNDWRNNADSVKDKLNYALTNENTHQDVVIIVGSGSLETVIKAHSFMLILGSQVFEKPLETAKVNNKGFKEIKMPNVRPEAMKFVMKYIYTDYVNMQDENALDILYVSLKLNLRRLSMLCIAKLQEEISSQNVLSIFEEAVKMNVQELVQISQDFILKNARDIFEREEFLNITQENLCKLLANDGLQMDEVSLLEFVLRWGEAECQRLEREKNTENLRLVLEKVLPLIRYPLMTSHQFATVVVPTNILDDKKVIDVYNYLCVKNSTASTDLIPPQWIVSSSARNVTVGEHSIGSTDNRNEHNLDVVEELDEPGNNKKERLLQYLVDIRQMKTICGLFCSDEADKGIKTIENITGVQPGVLSLVVPSNWDKEWQSFAEEIILHWNDGFLIRIVWDYDDHPLLTAKIKTKMGRETDEDETKWQDLMKDNGDRNKMWKIDLNALVPFFKQLQNAGVVIICDLLPYINNRGYLWGGRPGNDGSLKLYQITHDYLTRHHDLNYILWTWSVDYGDMTKLEDFWPGDNYVDIASVYTGGTGGLEMKSYHALLKVVGNKPISIDAMFFSLPTPELLINQPGWTWFSICDDDWDYDTYNNKKNIKTTFTSLSVISKGNIEFF